MTSPLPTCVPGGSTHLKKTASRTSLRPVGRPYGFTLVEIAIVVLIIGLLAAIAIPLFKTVRENAQNARIINDFRIFKDAFETCAMEKGQWPEDENQGILPDEMEGYIKEESFQEESPIGGYWDWDEGVFGITAGLSLYQSNADDEQMQKIDDRLDDGNLNSGFFRVVTGDSYTWVLEE